MRHFRCLYVQGFTVMDREWMYKTSRLHLAFLDHVTKFIATAKRHRLSLKRDLTICLCKSRKNLLAHGDDMVKSHLIQCSFVKDYTVWKFHGEVEDPSAGASGGGNSLTATTTSVNAEQQTSSAAAGGHNNAATSDNADHDYIMMDDLLQDMADDDDGVGNEPVRDPKTADLFESITNHLDHDDVLFGSPRWLEKFREMKEATIDPLYKDCLKN